MLRYIALSTMIFALLGIGLTGGCRRDEEPPPPETPETPEMPTEQDAPEPTQLPGDEYMPDMSETTEQIDETDVADLLQPLTGKRVAMLLTDGFQDAEARSPMEYLRGLGAEVTVIGPAVGTVTAYNSDEQVEVAHAVADVSVDDFDALVIPGGHSPENLREHEAVVDFAGEFFRSGKPVAAICHGPQVLVTADVLEGRTMTAYSGVQDELTGAGAEYVDEPMVRDGNLITSRLPGDLPQFNAAIAEALQEE